MNSTEVRAAVNLDWTDVCLYVLQVGCNPLSDKDEVHLNIIEKHVSSIFFWVSW